MSDLDLVLRNAIDKEVAEGIAAALKTISIIASPDGKSLQAVVLGRKHQIKGEVAIEPSPPSKSPLQLVRLSELAREIGVGPHTIRNWVKTGKFPPPIFINDAGAARWRVSTVDAWLEKCKRKRRRPPTPKGHFKRHHLTGESDQ